MHFMPDTEDADSAAESFWPEGYKKVIREDVRQSIGAQIGDGKRLRHIFQRSFSEKYGDLNQFINKVADIIAIGAENGADDTFEELMEAFLAEAPLPEERRYARYLWPQAFSPSIKDKLAQVVIDEYKQDDVYQHAYDSYYYTKFHSFDEFIDQIASTVVIGAMNSTDDMLEAIYQSFIASYSLPPARRYPRRLKLWVPA